MTPKPRKEGDEVSGGVRHAWFVLYRSEAEAFSFQDSLLQNRDDADGEGETT
jgi:hypothetical protein